MASSMEPSMDDTVASSMASSMDDTVVGAIDQRMYDTVALSITSSMDSSIASPMGFMVRCHGVVHGRCHVATINDATALFMVEPHVIDETMDDVMALCMASSMDGSFMDCLLYTSDAADE